MDVNTTSIFSPKHVYTYKELLGQAYIYTVTEANKLGKPVTVEVIPLPHNCAAVLVSLVDGKTHIKSSRGYYTKVSCIGRREGLLNAISKMFEYEVDLSVILQGYKGMPRYDPDAKEESSL